MTIEEAALRLHAQEINFIIFCFWDAGYKVQLADNINGITAESECVELIEVGDELIRLAKKSYPNLKF